MARYDGAASERRIHVDIFRLLTFATEPKNSDPTGVSLRMYWRPLTRGLPRGGCFFSCNILSEMLNKTTPSTWTPA